MTDTPPEHRRSLDAVPRELERVLVRALAIAPDDRFPTAAEFVKALVRLSAAPDAGRKRLWRVAALAALAVTLAAAIALLAGR